MSGNKYIHKQEEIGFLTQNSYRNSTTFVHLLASKHHAKTEYFRTIKVEDICFLVGARHYMTPAFHS